jgi:hypothetical protein
MPNGYFITWRVILSSNLYAYIYMFVLNKNLMITYIYIFVHLSRINKYIYIKPYIIIILDKNELFFVLRFVLLTCDVLVSKNKIN